jgi:hypothetical protein
LKYALGSHQFDADSSTGDAFIDFTINRLGMGNIVGMECALKGNGPLYIAQTGQPAA